MDSSKDLKEIASSDAVVTLTSLLESGVATTSKNDINKDGISEAVAGHVTEFTAGITPIGDAQVTTQAQQILKVDPEATVWQESPSLALLFAPGFNWLVVLSIVFFMVNWNQNSILKNIGERPTMEELSFLNVSLPENTKQATAKGKKALRVDSASKEIIQQRARVEAKVTAWNTHDWYVLGMKVVFFYAIASLLYKLLALKGTRYTMSSQRLIIETGVISKSSWPVELYKLGSSLIHKPLTLRFFGVSNLHVSGIMLEGLRNAELVRDLLRSAGQSEAQRTEKIRWR